MQLKTLLLVIVAPMLIVALLGVLFLHQKKELALVEIQKKQDEEKRQREAAEEREAKRRRDEEERRKRVPVELIRKAEIAEDRRDWKAAARLYTESLAYGETESTRRKLRAVNLMMQAEDLEKAGKRDEALVAYEQAREDLTNKKHVDEQVERIKGTQSYEQACAKGDEFLKAGKREEAIEAYEVALAVAKAHRINTDVGRKIQELRKRVEHETSSKDRMFGLIKAWAARKEFFALLAVYDACLKDARYAEVHDTLRKEKEALEQLIKQTPLGASDLRASGGKRLVTVSLKDGTVILGELLEETKSACKIQVVEEGGGAVNRLILRSNIASLEESAPEEINNAIARRLFGNAVNAYARGDRFEALKTIGQIQYEFPQSPILSDAEEQKTIIATQSLKLLGETGGSLDGIAARAVEFCRDMCFTCGGSAWVKCTRCQGTCRVRSPCDACGGKGVRPCDFCGGTGKVGGKTCSDCKGKKTRPCEFCQGKGFAESPCDVCVPHECPVCRGKKQKPIGPCPYCKGVGRIGVGAAMDCPKCGGTAMAFSEEPCPACLGSGVVGVERCPDCRGTGKRTD